MKLVYVRLLQCSIRFDCWSLPFPNARLCSIGKILGRVRLSSITDPSRRQSNDWSSIGFDYRTFDWPRRALGTHALICKLQMEIICRIKTYLWSVQFLNLLRSRVKLKLPYDAKNECYDVCVSALSVNFPMLYFMWFVLHITVGSLGCHYRLAFHCWFIN